MDYNELLNSIINDDLPTFERLTRPTKTYNVCFGRFPSLSLCYMYDSFTILKAHEGDMLKYTCDYIPADESIKIYEDFKVVAEKCLRFYLGDKKVEPLEMLALLGRTSHLKKIFPFAPRTEEQMRLIEKIYLMKFGEEVEVKEDKLVLPDLKIKDKNKSLFVNLSLISLGFTLCIAALLLVFLLIIGTGTSKNPYKVYTAQAFTSQASVCEYISLEKDLTLSSSIDNSSSTINGNGHTIYLNDAALIREFKGELYNVDIVVKFKGNLNDNYAPIIKNEGNIHNVKVTLDVEFAEETDIDDVYFAGIASDNLGEINNCKVSVSANVSSNGEGNSYFSGACGTNGGKIIGVSTTGKIVGETVDISGICSINNGEIRDCKNSAYIEQTSGFVKKTEDDSYATWRPNCAGIVLTNDTEGAIYDCRNEGEVKVISTFVSPKNEEGKTLVINEAYAGGVVAINLGYVEHSCNVADILVKSAESHAYIGGIAACNASQTINYMVIAGVLNACYSYGNLICDTTSFTLAGGIVGFNSQGGVTNCFENCEFVTEDVSNKALGGVIGMDICNIFDMIIEINIIFNNSVNNNFAVAKENAPYSIAALSYDYNGKTQSFLLDDTYVTEGPDGFRWIGYSNYILESLDVIKDTEIYWE